MAVKESLRPHVPPPAPVRGTPEVRVWAGLALLVGTLAAVASANPAAAQSATPTASVALALPPGPATIGLGEQHEVPLAVALTLGNLVCASEATAAVTLSVRDKPSPLAGVMAHATEDELTFVVPSGAYGSDLPAGPPPFNATRETRLMVMIAEDALPDHMHSFLVTATFAGGTPDGCRAAGAAPASEETAEHAIVTGPAVTAGSAADGRSPTTAPAAGAAPAADAESSRATPAPPTGVIALAAAAAAMAVGGAHRRRR